MNYIHCLRFNKVSGYIWHRIIEYNIIPWNFSVQFSSVAQLCPTLCYPMNSACQASLSITNSGSSLRLTSIESVIPFSHLILCRPLLLLPPIPPSIRVFSNESTLHMRWPKYWSFSFSIIPSKEIPLLISNSTVRYVVIFWIQRISLNILMSIYGKLSHMFWVSCVEKDTCMMFRKYCVSNYNIYFIFTNFRLITLIYRFQRKNENLHDTDLYTELIFYFSLLTILRNR